MAEPNEVLRFERVSKIYGEPGHEHVALSDVSAHVRRGAKIAIIGRSGSGKSTLLHLAAGIDRPSAGRVVLNGRDIGALGERERTVIRRDTIGLVFQFFHLVPHLSLVDNVLLPCWIAGETGRSAETRALSLLDKVGLKDRAADPVEQLSGGEMQRVAICRALVRKPPLLLADEPTGNLDDENGRIVMGQLLGLAGDEGSTLIYVTHSLELAAAADQQWRIHSGRLEAP